MAFSRNKYDDCATKLQVERSIGEGEYRLFPGFNENSQGCLSYDGPRNSKNDVSTARKNEVLDWGNMTQIESDLKSLNIPLTNCNENAVNMDYYKNETVNKLACNDSLSAEDTRFTYPVQAFRSMSLTGYQLQPFLFSNPQCHVIDDRIGLNSRNKAKDSYKTPKPNMVDNGEVLPKEDTSLPPLGYSPSQVQCK